MAEAKNRFRIKKISGITTKPNISSQKLLEKLGLRFMKYIKLPKDKEELMLYQWSQSKKHKNKLSL
jgi:RimJ/RimL family protein N-acetyltransferase